MDEIRAYACDSLAQLSHGGKEVGGVLYGLRSEGVIRFTAWRRIVCEYAHGDALVLSNNDRMNLAVEFEGARSNPDLKELRPVGWFVSHLQGPVAMTPADLDIYSNFFPESTQFTLVIYPTGSGRAEAGFFLRESDGNVRAEASYRTFVMQPPQAPSPEAAPRKTWFEGKPAVTPPATPVLSDSSNPAATAPVKPIVTPPPNIAPASPAATAPVNPVVTPPPNLAPASPAVTAPPKPIVTAPPVERRTQALEPALDAPDFQIDEPLPSRDRWLWAIPILLAVGIGGWVLYQSQKPAQSPRLGFQVSSTTGRTAQLEWNPDSPAIRAADRGEIDVTDGGQSSQVQLSADQLRFGKTTYIARSPDTTFELTVFRRSGEPVHESTRLIQSAAPQSTSTAPPAEAAAVPAPASPSQIPARSETSAADAALRRQVQQLKADLAKEHARAGELQNLNRILEERLNLEAQRRRNRP